MRMLLTLLPGVGSLHPLLPLARAAREAGHEVAFCSSRSFRLAVAVHGFRYFAAGLDWTVSDSDYIGLLCAAAGGVSMPAVSGLARLAWVTDHLFIGVAMAGRPGRLPGVVQRRRTSRRCQLRIVVGVTRNP